VTLPNLATLLSKWWDLAMLILRTCAPAQHFCVICIYLYVRIAFSHSPHLAHQ